MKKRALISVFYKENILEFSKFLLEQEYEILSTGGTYKYLKENGLPITEISEVTKMQEMLDGRVKTLHPVVHGAILAVRKNKEHMDCIEKLGIQAIDMVVVNLYPFFEKVQSDISIEEKIEFIDIGGPAMLRSAAKAFQDVIVITEPSDYSLVIQETKEQGSVSYATKKKLAGKVFNLTSAYDAAISSFLLEEEFPRYLNLSYEKKMDLRYGENPHQRAAYYVSTIGNGGMKNFVQKNGKELSFNNIRDMDVAWKVVQEFQGEIACCSLKHSTPCGVAVADTVKEAYTKAYACDSTSIFGGIVAFNYEVNEDTAAELVKIFLEIVIAPSYTKKAIEILASKKNLRVIECSVAPKENLNFVKVDGGFLVQEEDRAEEEDRVVTKKAPTKEELEDLFFGIKVVKHVKSNGIVVVKNKMALGIGTGEVNRIWATKQAIERAGEGGVLASDAFFPFRDVVDCCVKNGIKAIIQPGGSLKDQESIDACNEHGISMIFTGTRHFKH